MRKWFITVCMGAALAANVQAQEIQAVPQSKGQRTQLMSAAEMVSAARAVKNPKTQPLLEQWVRVCLQKEWGNCQIAWFNLAQSGGLTQIENDGHSTWGFLNQPDANEVLMHMVSGLNNPLYRPAWDMEITTSRQYADVPNIVDGRNALTDGVDQRIVLAIVQERFRQRNVAYHVPQEMPVPRLEWFRLIALMYTVRDDTASAYQALNELQKHAKMNPQATLLYNQTVQAVQAYIQKGKNK